MDFNEMLEIVRNLFLHEQVAINNPAIILIPVVAQKFGGNEANEDEADGDPAADISR